MENLIDYLNSHSTLRKTIGWILMYILFVTLGTIASGSFIFSLKIVTGIIVGFVLIILIIILFMWLFHDENSEYD